MATVLIGLGSNLGNRQRYLKEALNRLSRLPLIKLKAASGWIETAPMGGPPQGKYLNGVAQMETPLIPLELLHLLQAIEQQMGRPQKRVQWGPRVIDLDLLSYGDLILKGKTLTLPHPRMHQRPFVLIPLSQLSPRWRHPIFKLTAKQLLTKTHANRP